MKAKPQMRLRLSTEPNPAYCASAFCRVKRGARRPTHTVTVGKLTFRVCATCARPWESIRGATVELIREMEVAG